MTPPKTLHKNLWKIYERADSPRPTPEQIDRLWRGESFAERILDEHLDDTHGAASRAGDEQLTQIGWLKQKLNLAQQSHVLDVTCGPGLYAVKFAQQGCQVTGLDFSATAIAYAQELAEEEGVADKCRFIEQDVRQLQYDGANFDAAILLYGQLESFERAEAQTILRQIAAALKPGGRLCIEALNQETVDQNDSTWWYTDEQGVWGDEPYLHLGERFWHADEGLAVERYHIIHLKTGQMDEVYICNQTYSVPAMTAMLHEAGFAKVELYPAWDGLDLYDAAEWLVYVAEKGHE